MADLDSVRQTSERNRRTLTVRPSRGLLTGVTRARLVEGLRCEIEDGDWKLAADLPVKAGGDDSGPTPSVLGRSALASCLVLGISRWAARLEVPIASLEVEVQSDFDARAELGMTDAVPPGYSEVRYAVRLESPAPAEAVERLLELAERYSPYLDNFGRALRLRRVTPSNRPTGTAISEQPAQGLLEGFAGAEA